MIFSTVKTFVLIPILRLTMSLYRYFQREDDHKVIAPSYDEFVFQDVDNVKIEVHSECMMSFEEKHQIESKLLEFAETLAVKRSVHRFEVNLYDHFIKLLIGKGFVTEQISRAIKSIKIIQNTEIMSFLTPKIQVSERDEAPSEVLLLSPSSSQSICIL